MQYLIQHCLHEADSRLEALRKWQLIGMS